MSEDRVKQDEGEDVEAHKKGSYARKSAAKDEISDEKDDVEAHKKGSYAQNVEPGSDDESDDVEAHARRASHHHGV